MSNEESTKKEAPASKQIQDEFIKKLEEDDEFEDFPEDDWEDPQTTGANHETHLWEESWEDHDDYKDDFTQKLRYVFKAYIN
jgi:hypothetical protein